MRSLSLTVLLLSLFKHSFFLYNFSSFLAQKMRASTPPVCTHCQSTKSPLWRRGAQQEVLCNACGLYWKHHGCYRPLSLKAAADRKQESNGNQDSSLLESRAGSSSNGTTSSKDLTFHDFMKAVKAKQNLMAHFSSMNANAIATASAARTDPRKATGGPLKTANILMAPGQYGYSEAPLPSMATTLPPFPASSATLVRPDLSTPLPMSNARQIMAAPVLPNLRSVLDSQRQRSALGSMVMSSTAPLDDVPATVSVPPAVAKASTNLPLKFIINKGQTLYQGDHVAVLGDDSQVYFAILLDFWLTEGGRRFCTLRWLLPKASSSSSSSTTTTTETSNTSISKIIQTAPSLENLTLGPVHGKVESMEAILDVFYSPYREAVMSAEVIRKRFLITEQADEVAAKMLLSMS